MPLSNKPQPLTDRRLHGAGARSQHRDFRAQQAAGGDARIPAGTHAAVRPRRHLPRAHHLRSADRRPLVDGSHRRAGYDVYLLDLRGYGKSTRPPEMAQNSDANRRSCAPRTRSRTSPPAVDFILARRAIPRLTCSAGPGARSRRRLTPSRIRIKLRGLCSMRRSGSARPAGLRTPIPAACRLTAR